MIMLHDRFDIDGFCVLPDILTSSECERISGWLDQFHYDGVGSRSLLDEQWCQALAQSIRQHPAIARALPPDPLAVQCTYFEKSQDQNWLVPIHQDLSIPVREKVADPDLTGWSEKQGVTFVQPPAALLQHLVAVRLHIDACGIDDGALRIVPGSHQWGRLDNEKALDLRTEAGEVICPVPKGGALLIRPLALHASSKATGSSRRRVLHFVFGPRYLPYRLHWHQVV
jgi:hypothetical protein